MHALPLMKQDLDAVIASLRRQREELKPSVVVFEQLGVGIGTSDHSGLYHDLAVTASRASTVRQTPSDR
jgi:hypothetical protein